MDTDRHDSEVVIGEEHLRRVRAGAVMTLSESVAVLKDSEHEDYQIIGTALSVLYQAATCHRKCYQGPHIFEALCGRAYNLGVSAYLLALSGFYDESSNLIRSVGEIGNIISLAATDKDALQRWLESDRDTRIMEFSPAKVRKAIEAKRGVVIADADWYSDFCERFTHPTPGTKPNMHNESGRGFVGGVYQSLGLSNTLDPLRTVILSTAMYVAAFAKFDDLQEKMFSFVERIGQVARG